MLTVRWKHFCNNGKTSWKFPQKERARKKVFSTPERQGGVRVKVGDAAVRAASECRFERDKIVLPRRGELFRARVCDLMLL